MPVIEAHRRLSESMLWELQTNFYGRHGGKAWSSGRVPYFATSNAVIAHAYARVALAFLQDYYSLSDNDQLAPSAPVYIVELGSGSGRLAYYFLSSLQRLLGGSVLGQLRVTYVMTDVADQTLMEWQNHSALRPLVSAGCLDFARFDAAKPSDFTLLHSGMALSAATVSNPVVLIANYLFDSIPHDCFAVRDGTLVERLVSVSTDDSRVSRADPDILNHLALQYEEHTAPADYYADSCLNRILRSYATTLHDAAFLFPYAALQSLQYFRNLSSDRLLLLAADKGFSRTDAITRDDTTSLKLHGSFSVLVNFHAIGEFVKNEGGQVLEPSYPPVSIHVAAYLTGTHSAHCAATIQACADVIAQSGPDDFLSLVAAVDRYYDNFSLEQLLAYLRFCRYDSLIFSSCAGAILKAVQDATAVGRKELWDACQQVWDTHFPMHDERDLLFTIARLLHTIGYKAEAKQYMAEFLRMSRAQ